MGSFERFFAVLAEHFAGKWPMWMSPRQILVVPVMTAAEPYVKEVTKVLQDQGFFADSDLSTNTMKKKILNGQLMQYNFMLGKPCSLPSAALVPVPHPETRLRLT